MPNPVVRSDPEMPTAASAPSPRSLAGALANWLASETASLYPGCFALVMATGIISNALFLNGYLTASSALFAVNLVAYPWLLILTTARFVRFRSAVWEDLTNPKLVFSFFTIVASTDVFGVGIHLRGYSTIAQLMWCLALAVWFVLIYFSFAVLTFLNIAHRANVVHGGWLIAIVGTESLVVLGTVIAPGAGEYTQSIFVLIHMLWGIGLALYGIFIALFAYRIFFSEVGTDDITPLLWVVMGAAAISTNAGSTLILTESGVPFLHSMRPFIDGMTLMMWAWATWWIPLLLVFGIWKHGVRRVPITYTPMYWSLVFPLGMYALASRRLSLAADFQPLLKVSVVMMWIALAAWVITGTGFLRATSRSYRKFMARPA
jgi:tellurite resistance protein TehA-like permease